ncbi:DUF6185 family protein [Streptomyces sp. NPDC051211]|uniref:DUF6185 family protein n=1 Tax=Streptomyces sp. NPDC051211 TaxID=3154643 RepID=UPI00344E5558
MSLLVIACLVAVLLLITAWRVLTSGADTARRDTSCQPSLLKARVEAAQLGFQHRGRAYTQVQSDMTVKVPDTWPYARDLTLGEESPEYQNAMSCLLRGSEAADPKIAASEKERRARKAEWRFRSPTVTATGDWITVEYQAFARIEEKGEISIGPWGIEVGSKVWRVVLKPPDTLRAADWKRVEVGLGGLDASVISPEPSSLREGVLAWGQPKSLDISVEVDPPWQRSFTWTNVWSRLSQVGVVSWWLAASLVLAVAAVRALPRKPSPAPREAGRVSTSAGWLFGGRRFNEGPKEAVLYWAVLSAAVVLTLVLLMKGIKSPSWRGLIGIATGLALTLVARPWCRPALSSAQEPGKGAGVPDPQARQARAVTVTATAVAALGVFAVVALHFLEQGPPISSAAQSSGHRLRVLLALATLWLGLAAMTAWAWRFGREGGLIRKTWIKTWNSGPVRWVAVVSTLLAATAAVILACFWWAARREWKRVAWPGERIGIPGERVAEILSAIPLQGLHWVYAYSWVLAGIALVALLRIRVETQNGRQAVSLGPEGPDLLLTVAIFAFMVGLRQVQFAGASASLYALWFVLIMLSLYAVCAVGRRSSVLSGADRQFLSRAFGTRERRDELLEEAHEYRNWHHQIYLMEHGRANGDVERAEMEENLRGQARWLSGLGREHPAEHYSVVDVALAWGPEPRWWQNARHAAKLAFFFGIPASVALVWLTEIYQNWLRALHTPTGLLEIAAKLGAWQIAWAGAGMVLGALWRVLPGRRGPVRALSLTLAYALPVGVGVLLSRIADSEPGYALLNVLLMLTVLTMTSLWMDMATFSRERQFWPTRFGLLLSIYQMRGISAQIAYVLVQLVAAAAIWHELASRVGGPD